MIENAGGTNQHFAERTLPNAILTIWRDNLTMFGELIAGRADVMITDAVEAIYQAMAHQELVAVHPDRPFTIDYKVYLLPKASRLIGRTNQWLAEILIDGTINAIYRRWTTHSR